MVATVVAVTFDCRDCFEEAKLYLGIYDDSRVPKNKMLKFKTVYVDEFYYNHEDPNGPKATVRSAQ